MTIDRTASESGGRRDVREDMKTRAAVRTVMIPDRHARCASAGRAGSIGASPQPRCSLQPSDQR